MLVFTSTKLVGAVGYNNLVQNFRRFFKSVSLRRMEEHGSNNQRLKYISTSQSQKEKTDHLTRTSSNTREKDVYLMTVMEISNLSPTVKEVVLSSKNIPPSYTFKAGQWADVFLPGVETVGGFSMSSSPQELASTGLLRLSIKYSTHPPAYWIHNSCRVGQSLKVRFGGDFYVSLDDIKPASKIMLIAGGVGINPLSSIIRFIQDEDRNGQKNIRVCLLFSAKDASELLFKDVFENYKLVNPQLKTCYFVTGKKPSTTIASNVQERRIQKSDLIHAAKWLLQSDSLDSSKDIATYLCGPPIMIKAMTDNLNELEFRNPNFEQWW